MTTMSSRDQESVLALFTARYLYDHIIVIPVVDLVLDSENPVHHHNSVGTVLKISVNSKGLDNLLGWMLIST